jgi:hypothetical protein
MFVRFVVGAETDNAFRLDGVFTISSMVREQGQLFDHECALLEEIYDWFNHHLPCPPFRKKLRSGKWTRNAICWFRDEAGEPIKHIWDIVAILKEHGTLVRLIRTDRPGRIVYSDSYQIVAETPTWA